MAEVPKAPKYIPLFPDQGVHGEGVIEDPMVSQFAQQMQQAQFQPPPQMQPNFMQNMAMGQGMPQPPPQPMQPPGMMGQATGGMMGGPPGGGQVAAGPQPGAPPIPGDPNSGGPIARMARFVRNQMQQMQPNDWLQGALISMAATNPMGAANFALRHQSMQAQKARRAEDLQYREEQQKASRLNQEENREMRRRLQFSQELARLEKELAPYGLLDEAVEQLGPPENLEDLVRIREFTRDEKSLRQRDQDYEEELRAHLLRGQPGTYMQRRFENLPQAEERMEAVNAFLLEEKERMGRIDSLKEKILKLRVDKSADESVRGRVRQLQQEAGRIATEIRQYRSKITTLSSQYGSAGKMFHGELINGLRYSLDEAETRLLERYDEARRLLGMAPASEAGEDEGEGTVTPEEDPMIKGMQAIGEALGG